MVISKACSSSPGHVKFLDNRRVFPVVVSAQRYEDIMARSRMDKKHATLAANQDADRYMQYLKEGSDWLCSHFTNVGVTSLDEEKQAKLDQELREAEIREKQVKLEDDLNRKKRVLRANEILRNMKAGQRALHTAVVLSEVSRQRNYNEAINREITEDARRQKALDDEQCPEQLLVVGNVTDEELKAQEQAKAVIIRDEFMRDLNERRERKLAQQEEELYEVIVRRAQYQCLHDKEQKEAKERKESKRQFCRQAYRDALKEKAEIQKFENMCDKIDDRVICVDVTRRRNNDVRNAKIFKTIIANKIHDRELRAIQVCRMQQANNRKADDNREQVEQHYAVEVQMDEARRQCELQEKARERRVYQLEERRQRELEAQRQSQIRQFEIAERYKNQETNQRFNESAVLRKNCATENLRQILYGQREEFLERTQAEQMRMSACQGDPCLQDDVAFFKDAVKSMKAARKDGRSVFPMAKVVETYRRKNQIDVRPESRMVSRRKLRDYCWPGYFSKADFAYKQYAHRDKCRQELEEDHRGIFDNCIRITKMAAEEQPYKKCDGQTAIKCFQYRGMPTVESVDSFDCGTNVWQADDRLLAGCTNGEQIVAAIGNTKQSALPKASKTSNRTLCKSQKALVSRQLSDSLKSVGRTYHILHGKGCINPSKRSANWR